MAHRSQVIRTLARDLTRKPAIAPLENVWGTVVSVQTGPPKSLTVNLNGSSVNVVGVRYDSLYTFAPGDVFYGRRVGTDIIVEGKLA
jgi:hypothetical protein